MERSSIMGMQLGVAIMAALVAPFVLWPIEQVLKYPVVIEEAYKAVLVWLVLRGCSYNRKFWVFLVGGMFAVSETMFYLVSAMFSTELGNWGWRLVTTVPMHILTTMIQYGGWVIGVGPLGIIPAILGHGWFNQWVH